MKISTEPALETGRPLHTRGPEFPEDDRGRAGLEREYLAPEEGRLDARHSRNDELHTVLVAALVGALVIFGAQLTRDRA